ncbi:MAG: hypothetical protein J5973_06085 [Eubacterium sp.]|nr:hypothetical protein [Eubacterium sp.]
MLHRIKIAVYILTVGAMLLIPSVGMVFYPTKEPIGNTPLAEAPVLFTELDTWNTHFLSDAGEWFSSRFAFRPQAVTADAVLKASLFGESSQDEVIVGTDGWLYYASTMDDRQRKAAASERMLFNIAHNMALLQEAVQTRGGKFLFTVAPNKASLYPQHLPVTYATPPDTPADIERLLPYLEKERVGYTDLFSVLGKEKSVLYYVRDSHWTEEGAVLAYMALMNAAHLKPIVYLSGTPEETAYYGDLSLMLYPVGLYPETRHNYLPDPRYKIVNEAESVESLFIVAENPVAPAETDSVFLYRDSFGNSLTPYFADTFRRSAFSRDVPYRAELCGDYQLVIVEIAERHLQTISRAPALMEGPVRAVELAVKADAPLKEAGNDSTIVWEETADYYRANGHVSPRYLEEDGRIFVRVADDRGFTTYEAFCTSVGDDDYSYLLQIKKDTIRGDILGAQVLTVKKDTPSAVAKGGDPSLITVQVVSEYWQDASMAGTLVIPLEEDEAPDEAADREEDEAPGEAIEQEEEEGKTEPNTGTQEAEANPAESVREALPAEPITETAPAPASAPAATPAAPVPEVMPAEPVPEPAPAEPAPQPTGRFETGRQFIQDCYEGATGGYWDITYSDGTHEYIDVP